MGPGTMSSHRNTAVKSNTHIPKVKKILMRRSQAEVETQEQIAQKKKEQEAREREDAAKSFEHRQRDYAEARQRICKSFGTCDP